MELREILGNDIYESLCRVQKEQKVCLTNKAFITDFLSQKLVQLGYYKLDKEQGEPPVLSDKELWDIASEYQQGILDTGEVGKLCKAVAQAQRDACISWGLAQRQAGRREDKAEVRAIYKDANDLKDLEDRIKEYLDG